MAARKTLAPPGAMRGLVEFLAEGAFRDPCFSVRGVHPSEKSMTWTRQIKGKYGEKVH